MEATGEREPPLRGHRLGVRGLVWLSVALAVVLPRGGLTGNPDCDVWNHAWGYWWVAHALSHGQLPWATKLLSAPEGGVLWFIDPAGAMAATPITLLFGPHVAFEAVLVAEVALAGFFAQRLAEAIFGGGFPGWVAGVACATAPGLICEIQNGISEVTAIWWIPATLLAAERAVRGDPGGWRRLGVWLGCASFAALYYGLILWILVLLLWLARSRSVRGLALAAAFALPPTALGLFALRASLVAPGALITRSTGLNRELAEHNAVDPRVYVTPGSFATVDLARRYGESFRHTGYLRWSLILPAALAVWRDPRRAGLWAGLAGASLLLGLGPQLWFRGHWVVAGSGPVLLPFGVLQHLVPELGITHPLRLSVPGQVLVAVLAAAGLRGAARGIAWAIGGAAIAEGLFGSLGRWPIPESPAAVPPLYTDIQSSPDMRAVLDLPAEAGTTMATSRYFWFQTVSGRAVPYGPHARANATGDPISFAFLPNPRSGTDPGALDAAAIDHLRSVYGWIVLHPELARPGDSLSALSARLEAAFGPPTLHGALPVWTLPAPAADFAGH